MKKLLISLFVIMCFKANAQRMLVLPDTPRFANQNKGVFVLRTADNIPYYSNGFRWVAVTAGSVTPSTINDSLNAYNLRNVTSYNGLRGAVRGADTIYLNSTADTLKWRIAGVTYSGSLGSGGAGVTDSDKGDITVSSGGSVWKLNDTLFTNPGAEFGKTIKTFRPVSAPYSSLTNSKFGLNVITDENHRTYIQDGQIVLKNNFPFIALLGKNNEIVNSFGYDSTYKHAYIDMRSNIDFVIENNSNAWLYNIGSQSSLFPSKYWGYTAMCGGNQNLVVGYPFFGDPGMPTDKDSKLTVYGNLKVASDTFKLNGKFFANNLPVAKRAKQLFWNPNDSTISVGDTTGAVYSAGSGLRLNGGAFKLNDSLYSSNHLFYDPVKSAFRTGSSITSALYSRDSLGTNSAAFGLNNKSKGANTFTYGAYNGNNSAVSFVGGQQSYTASIADYSFVAGDTDSSFYQGGTVFGFNNKQFGNNNFVTGWGNRSYSVGHTVFGIGNDTTGSSTVSGIAGNQGVILGTDPLFTFGNGTPNAVTGAITSRSNALQIYRNGFADVYNIWSYKTDLSASFTNRSLVDKEYVDKKEQTILTPRGVEVIESVTGDTLTIKNKTYVVSTTSASSITINADTTDMHTVTALATNLTINAPTGTLHDGQPLLIRIKDDGTSRTLTWNSIFRASTDFALPTSTTISKTMYVQLIYNATDTKWDAVGLTNGF